MLTVSSSKNEKRLVILENRRPSRGHSCVCVCVGGWVGGWTGHVPFRSCIVFILSVFQVDGECYFDNTWVEYM